MKTKLLIAGIVIMLLIIFRNKIEHFVDPVIRQECSGCGNFSASECANCDNCGLCITPSGRAECVEGNESGPLFRQDCVSYSYGSSSTPVTEVTEIVPTEVVYTDPIYYGRGYGYSGSTYYHPRRHHVRSPRVSRPHISRHVRTSRFTYPRRR